MSDATTPRPEPVSPGPAPASPGPAPPEPTRRRRDRELWVGVFAIGGILAILAALFALTDASTFRGRYVVTTSVPDAAGIRRGDPVQLRGVNIGRVQRFDIGPGGVAIHLEIEGEYRVPRDSRVRLRSGGLLDGRLAEILPGTSDEPLQRGDAMPGSTADTLAGAAERLAGESEQVLERVQALLSERTIEDVQESSAELAELLRNLSAGVTEQRASLDQLSKSFGRTAVNLERATGPELLRSVARLDALTRRMEGMTPEIERTVASLGRTTHAVESVMGRIDRGQGTLGRLSRDDALYVSAARTLANIDRAALELGLLGQDIRMNPGRYVKFSLF